MLTVIMPSVVMLSVTTLSVIMLNVVAPNKQSNICLGKNCKKSYFFLLHIPSLKLRPFQGFESPFIHFDRKYKFTIKDLPTQ